MAINDRSHVSGSSKTAEVIEKQFTSVSGVRRVMSKRTDSYVWQDFEANEATVEVLLENGEIRDPYLITSAWDDRFNWKQLGDIRDAIQAALDWKLKWMEGGLHGKRAEDDGPVYDAVDASDVVDSEDPTTIPVSPHIGRDAHFRIFRQILLNDVILMRGRISEIDAILPGGGGDEELMMQAARGRMKFAVEQSLTLVDMIDKKL